MSIQLKFFFILLSVILVFVAFDALFIHQQLIFPDFIELEELEAGKNIDRCSDALKSEIQHLEDYTRDWAYREDTYKFLQSRNPAYLESNLPPETFVENNLDFICFFTPTAEFLWGRMYDFASGELFEPAYFKNGLLKSAGFARIKPADLNNEISGVTQIRNTLYIAALQRIPTSENKGSVCAFVLMGRKLDRKMLNDIAKQVRVSFMLYPVAEEKSSSADLLVSVMSDTQPYYHDHEAPGIIRSYTSFPDLTGAKAFILRTSMPEIISAAAAAALLRALVSMVIVGAVILVVMLMLLQVFVVRPLMKLTAHVKAVGNSDDLGSRLEMSGSDEISVLANEFNIMVDQLARARIRKIDQSYYSGMSKSVSELLHNVRNCLNPIMVRIDLLRLLVRGASLENLEVAVSEILSGSTDPARLQSLKDFVNLTNSNFKDHIDKMEATLLDIVQQVDKVDVFLKSQKKITAFKHERETVNLGDLCPSLIPLSNEEQKRHITFSYDRNAFKNTKVKAHRIHLQRVVKFHLGRALKALQSPKVKIPTITIECSLDEYNGRRVANMAISDNRIVADMKDLENMYKRSSRNNQEGPDVVDYHWCINTMREMGGDFKLKALEHDQGVRANIYLEIE